MSTKIKEFWDAHAIKILTVVAVILTAVVSFQAGQTHEKQKISANVEVSINQNFATNPAKENVKILGEALERKDGDLARKLGSQEKKRDNAPQNVECILVGSKNSDKYHLPSCTNVARIKLENQVCFSSVEDATSKGYKEARCCHK